MKERMGKRPPIPGASSAGESAFWVIERCWDCPNAVIDLEGLTENIKRKMKELDFETRRKKVLNTSRPMHHQVFRISISGCPNSCSQPQIKDIGIQGQARPEVGEGCTHCGECVVSCPDGLITLTEAGPVLDREKCLNCGRCVRSCPAGVLTSPDTGFRVLVGGKLGRHPRLAETAVAFGGMETVESTLKAAVHLMTDYRFARERLGNIIEKIGVNRFKEQV